MQQRVQSTYSKRHTNSKTEHSKNYSYCAAHEAPDPGSVSRQATCPAALGEVPTGCRLTLTPLSS
jgi:hypothetical protein